MNSETKFAKKEYFQKGGQSQRTFAQGYSAFAQDYHVPSVTLRQFFGLHDTIALLMSPLSKFAEAINKFVFTIDKV